MFASLLLAAGLVFSPPADDGTAVLPGRLAADPPPGSERAPAPGVSDGTVGLPATISQTMEDLGLTIYGHFKLDAAYDSAETQFGNTAFWVRDQDKDEEINIHARHSRLGFRPL